MTSFIVKRLSALVPVWLLVSLIAFGVMHLAPGDPASVILGQEATPEAIEHLRVALGLNRPLYLQFAVWLGRVFKGDLGNSIFLDKPVLAALLERLPVTAWITACALCVALLVGIPAGILASIKRRGPMAPLVMVVSLLGLSTPEFLVGLSLLYIFSVALGWLPLGGFVSPVAEPLEALKHLLMPSITLGLAQVALIARMTRSSMLEVLDSDYVRTARSKGLAEGVVVMRHALRNALIPVITVIGMAIASLLAGTFVTESVFNLPGMGSLVIMAVKRRDYPLIQGGMLVVSTFTMIANLLVDIAYVYLDPRIKYE